MQHWTSEHGQLCLSADWLSWSCTDSGRGEAARCFITSYMGPLSVPFLIPWFIASLGSCPNTSWSVCACGTLNNTFLWSCCLRLGKKTMYNFTGVIGASAWYYFTLMDFLHWWLLSKEIALDGNGKHLTLWNISLPIWNISICIFNGCIAFVTLIQRTV